jgi:hypothetical protein
LKRAQQQAYGKLIPRYCWYRGVVQSKPVLLSYSLNVLGAGVAFRDDAVSSLSKLISLLWRITRYHDTD